MRPASGGVTCPVTPTDRPPQARGGSSGGPALSPGAVNNDRPVSPAWEGRAGRFALSALVQADRKLRQHPGDQALRCYQFVGLGVGAGRMASVISSKGHSGAGSHIRSYSWPREQPQRDVGYGSKFVGYRPRFDSLSRPRWVTGLAQTAEQISGCVPTSARAAGLTATSISFVGDTGRISIGYRLVERVTRVRILPGRLNVGLSSSGPGRLNGR